MGNFPYTGLITAMVTPFAKDGSVAEDAAVELARYLVTNGSDGIVVAGTTGESATLSEDEQCDLFKLMADELRGECAVIASTGSNDTQHAVRLTANAVACGVDAILSVTPYYNKPNIRGVLRHYEEIAKAAEGTPIILYNIPGRTALNLSPGALAELAQIDNVKAVKQANGDELGPIEGLEILAGDDPLLGQCLDRGGAGGICVASHIIGPEMKRMIEEPAARSEIDRVLQPLFTALSVTTNPIPIKAALNLLGHDVGGLRLPLVSADEDETATIRAALAEIGLLEGAWV